MPFLHCSAWLVTASWVPLLHWDLCTPSLCLHTEYSSPPRMFLLLISWILLIWFALIPLFAVPRSGLFLVYTHSVPVCLLQFLWRSPGGTLENLPHLFTSGWTLHAALYVTVCLGATATSRPLPRYLEPLCLLPSCLVGLFFCRVPSAVPLWLHLLPASTCLPPASPGADYIPSPFGWNAYHLPALCPSCSACRVRSTSCVRTLAYVPRRTFIRRARYSWDHPHVCDPV